MSSDSNIYIKTIETASDLGSFDVVATFNPTDSTLTENIVTSLITPNPTKTGYDVSKTSFVVGSTSLNSIGGTIYDTRMLFEKSTGAFRAGTAVNTQWDTRGNNSIALGSNNTATAEETFAAGGDNNATAANAVAIGESNEASAANATAIGESNNASAANATVIGQGNEASAANATAIGGDNNATAANATAIGENNTSSGVNSVTIGKLNNSYGQYSTAIGFSNIVGQGTGGTNASGVSMFAIGDTNLASGDNTVAIGNNNTIGHNTDQSKRYTNNSIVIGTSNQLTGISATTSNNSIILGSNCTITNANYATAIGRFCKTVGDNSVAIGYGTGTSDSASNRASATGAIAIGYKCQARTAYSICMGYCASVDVEGTGDGQNEFQKLNTFFWNGDSGSDPATYAYNNGSACFRIGNSGEFRIQTRDNYGVYLRSSTSYHWANNSDRNLKENLVEHDYNDTLAKIIDMPIYTYNYKSVDPDITSIGPTAQDFNRLFPSGKSKLHISDNDKCGVALAGIKGVKLGLDNLSSDVNTRFDSLSESVDFRFASNSETTSALQSRIAVLEAKIAAIENRLAT